MIFKEEEMKKTKLIFILAITFAIVLSGCGKKVETKTVDMEKDKKSSVYFENNVAEMEDIKVKITKVKVIKVGEKGNEYGKKPVMAFWYTATNKTGKDLDAISCWFAFFKAYQDNDPNVENELKVGMAPDERFLDSDNERIKKGGSVKSATAYELDDTKTPVKLVARQGSTEKKIGEIEYKIKKH